MTPNEVDAPRERVRQTEHERAEATGQLAGTGEALKVIADSPLDLAPVFTTVLKNAVRLCRADAGVIWKADEEGRFHRVSHLGGSPAYNDLRARSVVLPCRDTVVGKVA